VEKRGKWKESGVGGLANRSISASFRRGESSLSCEMRDGGNMYFGGWSHGEKSGKGLSYIGDFLYYGTFCIVRERETDSLHGAKA